MLVFGPTVCEELFIVKSLFTLNKFIKLLFQAVNSINTKVLHFLAEDRLDSKSILTTAHA